MHTVRQSRYVDTTMLFMDKCMQVSIHQTQVLYPELGSLESRVSKFYLDELFSGSGPDLEETAYWFHTPEGGWIQGETTMKAAPEAPVTFADPSHEDWETEGRVSGVVILHLCRPSCGP